MNVSDPLLQGFILVVLLRPQGSPFSIPRSQSFAEVKTEPVGIGQRLRWEHDAVDTAPCVLISERGSMRVCASPVSHTIKDFA